jgi:epoxyqueuosine reductase
VGIARAEPSAHSTEVRQWLAEGRHGQMAYLSEPQRLESRLDPAQFLPGAKSIICVADRYVGKSDQATERPSDQRQDTRSLGRLVTGSPPSGRIARYAWGADYHITIKKRLHRVADALREAWPEHEFRTAVDTAPILEREHAQRAGLGWVGKNTLLIHPRAGSWLLLGEIVTTLPLQTTIEAAPGTPGTGMVFPGAGNPGADHCGTCTRCIDACPTSCIARAGYAMDASRCISYLTIEHRGLIDPALHRLMGAWLAGCDVCQEVCPFNRPSEGTGNREQGTGGSELGAVLLPPYAPRPPAPALNLLEVLNWSEADWQRAFRGSALKRIKLDEFKRNALIAARNFLREHEDPALRRRIAQLACDEAASATVRTTAAQVLAQNPSRAG